MKKEFITLTTQTKLELSDSQKATLDAYARLFCESKRRLTALTQRGQLDGLKRSQIRELACGNQLAYRQFKGVESAVSGMMDSRKSNNKNYITNTESKIANRTKRLKKSKNRLESPLPNDDIEKLKFDVYQQQRGINRLNDKLSKLKSGKMSFCFGGKKLLKERSELQEDQVPEWKARWDEARHDELVLVGSSDESHGNQNCQLIPNDNGGFNAFIRLAPALEDAHGTHLKIPVNLRYYYDDVLLAASNGGTPLTYRFKRKNGHWYVFITFRKQPVEIVSSRALGTLGVDVNADHLAATLVTSDGNYKRHWTLPLPLRGKSSDQRNDIIGNAVKSCTDLAEKFGVAISIEDLDFTKKKRALDKTHPEQARMLSALSYGKIKQSFHSRCARLGIELVRINPAYTSQIGAIKYKERFNLSTHHAAAMVIARRGIGLTESTPKEIIRINGGLTCFHHAQESMRNGRDKIGKALIDNFNRTMKARDGYVLTPENVFSALAESTFSAKRLSIKLSRHVQKVPNAKNLELLTTLRIEQ